ncbi:MAG: hypothetical protein LR017_03125 [Candidatus Pacebacteria bacterium]|nr:hypothetical protein [Candidatus Paceibacterota bacterium]
MKQSDKRLITGLYATAFCTLFFCFGIISGASFGLLALGLSVLGVLLFERGDVRPLPMITASVVGFASGVCAVVLWIGGTSLPIVLSWVFGAVVLFHFLVWIDFRREKYIHFNS